MVSRNFRPGLFKSAVLLMLGYVFVIAHGVSWETCAAIGAMEIDHASASTGERTLRKAIARAEVDAPEDPQLAAALRRLARHLSKQGRHAEAEPLALRALAIRERAFGREGLETAESLSDLASIYHARRWDAAATPLLVQALAIRRQALEPTSPLIADSLRALADIEATAGHYEKALPRYEQALAIMENGLEPEHPSVVAILNGLGLVEQISGRRSAARRHLTRALEILVANSKKKRFSPARALDRLESAGRRFGWSPEAGGAIERQLRSLRTALEPKTHEAAAIHNSLGIIAAIANQRVLAESHFERAADIEEAMQVPTALASRVQYNLGTLYIDQGRRAEAQRAYENALRIAQRALRQGHPLTTQTAEALASLARGETVIVSNWQAS